MTDDANICRLCDQIKNSTETVSRLHDEHEQLNSDLLLCKNVNKHLEEKVTKVEKAQAMFGQYSQRNNIELAGIPNSIRDNDLEEIIINTCKGRGIDISKWILRHAIDFLLVMPKLPQILTNVRELL